MERLARVALVMAASACLASGAAMSTSPVDRTDDEDFPAGPLVCPGEGLRTTVSMPSALSTLGTVTEKWKWAGLVQDPEYPDVAMSPCVVNLTDDNDDGLIDELDSPEVVFIHFDVDRYPYVGGRITAVDGATSSELFTIEEPRVMLTGLAAGDLDGDGVVELVAIHEGGTYLVAFDSQGNPFWTGEERPQPLAGAFEGIGIADLDRDGSPEIYVRAAVFRADGSFCWQGTEGTGSNYPRADWPIWLGVTHAVDLDMQGDMEILAGRTAYRSNGDVFWNAPGLEDGYAAVGDFDTDVYPEVVLVSRGKVYLLDHLGNAIGAPYVIPGSTPDWGWGSSPVIANLDPDGMPEVVVVNGERIEGLDWNGAAFVCLWSTWVRDQSQQAGATALDFDDDGIDEVLYRDESNVYIFDGSTGNPIFVGSFGSGTGIEYPLAADIDSDGRAEIVVGGCCDAAGAERGVIAYECEDWVAARPVWNQYAYHVTNVCNDGTIPQYEENSWEATNNYLTQVGSYYCRMPGLVTGGGWIAGDPPGPGSKRTFGFNAHSLGQAVWGQVQFIDHVTKLKVHSDTVSALVIHEGDTVADFSGDCRVREHGGELVLYTFECKVMDRGEPGRGVDWFSLNVYDGDGNLYYSAGDYLGGGNIQIHQPEDRYVEGSSETDRERGGGLRPKGVGAVLLGGPSPISNSPNPFRGSTVISYELVPSAVEGSSVPSHITLRVYDGAGRLVTTLVDGELKAGLHTVTWETGDALPGIYFYRLTAGGLAATAKMVVLK